MVLPKSQQVWREWCAACDNGDSTTIKRLGAQVVVGADGHPILLANSGNNGHTQLHAALTRGSLAAAEAIMTIPGVAINQVGFYVPALRISDDEMRWPPHTALDVALNKRGIRNLQQYDKLIGDLRAAGAKTFGRLGLTARVKAVIHYGRGQVCHPKAGL